MKKHISALVVSFLLLLCCTGCGEERAPLTPDQFTETMETQGFTVSDVTSQFEEGATEAVIIAQGDKYQIEFYVLPSADQTNSAFETNKRNFEDAKGNTSTNKSASVKNFRFYQQSTNEQYYYVSTIDNTMIYTVVDKDYAEDVSKIIEGLGY